MATMREDVKTILEMMTWAIEVSSDALKEKIQ